MLFRALNDGGKFEWEGDIFHLAAIPLAVLNSRNNLSVVATHPWTHMTVPYRRLRPEWLWATLIARCRPSLESSGPWYMSHARWCRHPSIRSPSHHWARGPFAFDKAMNMAFWRTEQMRKQGRTDLPLDPATLPRGYVLLNDSTADDLEPRIRDWLETRRILEALAPGTRP